jgi:hypothetical protein
MPGSCWRAVWLCNCNGMSEQVDVPNRRMNKLSTKRLSVRRGVGLILPKPDETREVCSRGQAAM